MLVWDCQAGGLALVELKERRTTTTRKKQKMRKKKQKTRLSDLLCEF
jgi:hypothetical protein